MEKTAQQYHEVIASCRNLFLKKAADYGPSWTILRLPSVTDQILIKAERIRSLQETGVNKVGESETGEFIAIVNYCVIALILFQHQDQDQQSLNAEMSALETLTQAYDANVKWAFETMERKNHDYGEAWRKLRISSITDLILMKINRLKQIEDNAGKVSVSEGVDANYIDMLNYAVFVLIKKQEAGESF
ncbi:MAG: DUF1599 domain-containing protein [Bacteroidota bacterium]